MQQPGFNPRDVQTFNSARELERLDVYSEATQGSPFSADDRWKNGSVNIRLPKEGVSYSSEDDAPLFSVSNVYHRSLTEVASAACQHPSVRDWNFIPYRLFWLRDSAPDDSGSPTCSTEPSDCSSSSSDDSADASLPRRPSALSPDLLDAQPPGLQVYSEAWHADAWHDEDAEMRSKPREAGDPDDLEYAILPMQLYSDSTHLTDFGHASLWPIYVYFLTQSKYTRGRPSVFPAHHLAYIPSLPDTLQDFYIKIYSIAATAAVLTYLKRELIQQVWLLLLDEPFMYAYVHGLVLLCGDGIRRRLFLRFLMYAADYPEKILLACLKYFATCPCPRCRINKDKIIEMGTLNDLHRRNWVRQDNRDVLYRIKVARRWLFEDGLPLTSKYMGRILDPLSITPTRSAFSIRLHAEGFNFYSLFVPDLMHECELGVWKSTWIHLLRILYALGNDKIQELNRRFRQIPSFGRATIRRFASNVSGQGKLAARDFEARLKCFCPAYEGLLTIAADNSNVLDLGFDLATWHALAKLREHTTLSVNGLDAATVECGRSVRLFAKKTCSNYVTLELPSKDHAARTRRKAVSTKLAANQAPRKRKMYNYTTYKFHSMRDFAPAIRAVSATDNYNTQVGELEHRHVKRYYARTNKNHANLQIAQHMRRGEKLRLIKLRVDAWRAARKCSPIPTSDSVSCWVDSPALNDVLPTEDGPLPYVEDPRERYHVADSQRDHEELTAWVSSHSGDLALTDFIVDLKNHILLRLAPGRAMYDADCTAADRMRVLIRNNQFYSHQVCRVNYTTYDRQRSQDSINPRTHSDVLLLSPEARRADSHLNTHIYMYARVLKVFHVNVRLVDAPSHPFKRMDICWVRWFELDPSFIGGFETKRLPHLRFVPIDSLDDSFGFINPSDIIRGAHLIPAFAYGHTGELLPGPTIARRQNTPFDDDNRDTDFRFYYVNIFADRDMFMRYYGGGIGHCGLQTPSQPSYHSDPGDEEPHEEMPAACLDASLPSLDASTQRSQGPSSASIEEEAHCEEDVLRLVPEFQTRVRGCELDTTYDDDEGLAGLERENDSEDEELIASADLPVDAADGLSECGENHNNSLEAQSDGGDDEYGVEDYAPL
ncbi:hypothetical protein PYCCODRAFT_1357030 [Trametes coccinea BRFM310]|uniref:Uncharacterized protein n=1 Tax=Trametes coccinea (strain BRFM310) TaxID=1353009 RepID=A0A1Y2J5J3_TRAC3|nr:hypothetical protein PYCCODRAFT_1357030 [Trametes coccinea BRFM310]